MRYARRFVKRFVADDYIEVQNLKDFNRFC
jgi:hypothetical protein